MIPKANALISTAIGPQTATRYRAGIAASRGHPDTKDSAMTFHPSLHAISFALVLGACADTGANYTPIIDGSKSPAFASDLGACQGLAASQRQYDNEAKAAAVLGAGVGALVGLADGGEADDALGGAVAGALIGGVAGGVEAQDRKKAIVIACMRGRGHKVVG